MKSRDMQTQVGYYAASASHVRLGLGTNGLDLGLRIKRRDRGLAKPGRVNITD